MKKFGPWTDSAGNEKGNFKRCYETHPALKIGKFQVYGGSCLNPAKYDADTYVGLDPSMQLTSRMYPWNGSQDVLFPITDTRAPKDPEEFKKLIEWIVEKLNMGRLVHVGCIGGHGRTGLVLTALVAELTKEKDPIKYVREHYCNKAVESQEQIDFLVKHYGVKKAEPTKTFKSSVREIKGDFWNGNDLFGGVSTAPKYNDRVKKELIDVKPVSMGTSIWDA